MESITTRRFYTRLLNELSEYDDLEILESYPHATDEVRQIVEEVADQLEALNIACIIQVDQLEDAARNTRTFEQLLAALQSVGDLGESEPVFILFLFGTERAGDRIDELRETLSSRRVAKDRTLERFGFTETEKLIARWLAWARKEEYDSGSTSTDVSGKEKSGFRRGGRTGIVRQPSGGWRSEVRVSESGSRRVDYNDCC